MSFITGTVVETLYTSIAAGATLASFTTEAQLNTTATMGVLPHLSPDFWLPNQSQTGRGFRIEANGVLGSTGTPTFTFTLRGGAGGNITTNPLLAGTAALTLATTLTAVPWKFSIDLILSVMGAAGPNSTLRGQGELTVGGITASIWPVWGGASSPGTVSTLDTSITNYLNLNVACGASNAANTVTLNSLRVFGLN
jgi:hypothetical protein